MNENQKLFLLETKLHSSMNFQGMKISIEVPANGKRKGKSKDGKEWEHKIDANYGYILGTHSPDNELLDCYVRKLPNPKAKVYVVHQMTIDGSKFDEDKVMLGYNSASEARASFKNNTFKPNTMYGGMTEFNLDHFKLAAYSASNSKVILTDEETYQELKKKGKLPKGIISPIQVARRVSESVEDNMSNLDNMPEIEYKSSSEANRAFRLSIEMGIQTVVEHNRLIFDSPEGMEEFIDVVDNQQLDKKLLGNMSATLPESTNVDFNRMLEEMLSLDLVHESEEPEETDEDFEEVSEKRHVVILHTQLMENVGNILDPNAVALRNNFHFVKGGFKTHADAQLFIRNIDNHNMGFNLQPKEMILGLEIVKESYYRQFYEDIKPMK